MKTEIRSTGSLKRHPLHKAKVAAPDKTSAEWAAFVETIRADGRIRDAVKITEDGLVMDGWWRVEAARDLCLDVPCEINDAGEAALLIVESLTARKQMTRGATVYLALGMLAEYSHAAELRRLRNAGAKRVTGEESLKELSGTGQGLSSTRQVGSIRYLATRWGVNHETVHQAMEVRKFLHDPKHFAQWCEDHNVASDRTQEDLRAEFEPLLFNGEKSLWKIIQAAAGALTTEGKPKRSKQLELFGDRFTDFITCAARLGEPCKARAVIDRELESLDEESLLATAAMGKEIQSRALARLKELKGAYATA
jgi:hypothetical protein